MSWEERRRQGLGAQVTQEEVLVGVLAQSPRERVRRRSRGVDLRGGVVLGAMSGVCMTV